MAPKKKGSEKAPAAKPAAKKEGGGKKDSKAKPPKAAEKAVKAKKAVLRGVHSKRNKKFRPSVHFRRPKTLSLPRAPKYPKKSVSRVCK
eukprot:XP_011444792.1 PREDICTED: 60S ribosomal protein L23a-like [Crassostrea gigas]